MIKKKVKFIFFLVFIFLIPIFFKAKELDIKNHKPIIHKAHLSTGWYYQDKNILDSILKIYFDIAKKDFDVVVDPGSIKALIVPHAGIYFSGFCAASAYQTLFKNKEKFEKNKKIKRVIILCPSHVKSFSGICLPDYDIYQTVLGNIKVDNESIEILKKRNIFKNILETHCYEHAIEVQLPFLQKTIESFSIIPLICGSLQTEDYSTIVDSLKDIIDDKTLVVISSDFTHHGKIYNYEIFKKNILDNVRFMDSVFLQAIILKSFKIFDEYTKNQRSTICGQIPIKILLKLLEEDVFGNVNTRVASYYTTSQLQKAHNKDKIDIDINLLLENVDDDQISNSVSYLGLIFTSQKIEDLKKEDRLTEYEKKSLLTLSRRTISNYFRLENEKIPQFLLWPILGEGIRQSGGSFVTLHTKNGCLQGCMGRIYSQDPLYKTVQNMSDMAAFNDKRFSPFKKEELNDVKIDISVLTPPKTVKSYGDIKLGKHGIILNKQNDNKDWISSVFLPNIPTSLGWNVEMTLQQLSLKAGFGREDWKKDCVFEIFETYQIQEE